MPCTKTNAKYMFDNAASIIYIENVKGGRNNVGLCDLGSYFTDYYIDVSSDAFYVFNLYMPKVSA